MQTAPNQDVTQVSVFHNEQEKDLLIQDWNYGSSKAKKSIFIIAGIFLANDLLALSTAGLLNSTNFVFAMLVPLLFAGIGMLASRKPLLAMILASILFIGIHVLTFITNGAPTILYGWLMKAVMIYFIINGFRHAMEAEAARKKMDR